MIYRKATVSSTGPKQAIYENLAGVAQALGHAHRLELLEHLAQGMRSVEELSARARTRLLRHSNGSEYSERATCACWSAPTIGSHQIGMSYGVVGDGSRCGFSSASKCSRGIRCVVVCRRMPYSSALQ